MLRRLADMAGDLGEIRLRDEALQLADRAGAGRFYVACVGQFKRGKSTLLNALVGDTVLPAGVVPVTAVPTIVRHGALGARIRFADGAWREVDPARLADYVSEASNPENIKGVVAAEVLVPSPLLHSGMCLVDTPGLGSVFRANTEATRAFVPHVDAALIVLGADPPIGGDELALVEAVAEEVTDLIVVLNKADRTSDRDLADAATFTRQVLEGRLGRPIGHIYEVSGLERLEQRGPPRDWPRLVETLEELARGSGATLARQAARRGEVRIARRLLEITGQHQEALTLPLAESEARITTLAAAGAQADRWLRDLAAVMASDERDVLRRLDTDRSAFVAAALPEARRDLDARLAVRLAWWGPRVRRLAMAAAVDAVRARIGPWLDEQRVAAAAAFTELSARFQKLEREFVARVAALGVPEFSGAADAAASDRLEGKPSFYFQAELRVAEPASPLRHAIDVVLALIARDVFRRDADRFLVQLLKMNSWRVRGEVTQRVEESRRRLERMTRATLADVQATTARALAEAKSIRSQGAEETRAALDRLGALAAELRARAT